VLQRFRESIFRALAFDSRYGIGVHAHISLCSFCLCEHLRVCTFYLRLIILLLHFRFPVSGIVSSRSRGRKIDTNWGEWEFSTAFGYLQLSLEEFFCRRYRMEEIFWLEAWTLKSYQRYAEVPAISFSWESLGAQSHLGFLHCTRFCCVMQN
jgi:hypothetical protein